MQSVGFAVKAVTYVLSQSLRWDVGGAVYKMASLRTLSDAWEFCAFQLERIPFRVLLAVRRELIVLASELWVFGAGTQLNFLSNPLAICLVY